jgi:circadian clock protein KaiB
MARKKKPDKSVPSEVTTMVVMRLYIANNAPNSLMAISNLAAICQEFLQDNFKLEIVDVLEEPLRALADGILVTPSLAKLSPSPAAKIVGNLSDRSSVIRALGIRGASS